MVTCLRGCCRSISAELRQHPRRQVTIALLQPFAPVKDYLTANLEDCGIRIYISKQYPAKAFIIDSVDQKTRLTGQRDFANTAFLRYVGEFFYRRVRDEG